MTLTAFGDSITVGSGSTGGNTGYAQRVAAALGEPLDNRGISGAQVPDVAAKSYTVGPWSPGDRRIWLAGYNDMRARGASPLGLAAIRRPLAAQLVWLALPAANRVIGQSPSAVVSSGWGATPAYGGALGRSSMTAASTWSAVVEGRVIYLGMTAMIGSTYGPEAEVSIDGMPICVARYCDSVPNQSGLNYAPFLARIDTGVEGAHTVVVTVRTSTGYVYVDWVGGNAPGDRPTVYLGNCLRMPAASYGMFAPFNKGSDAAVEAVNRMMGCLVCGLQADGLDVRLVDASAAFDPVNVAADGIHPNNAGHQQIADAFLLAMS